MTVALALNKPKLDNLAGDIWKSAERLRGKFKAYEYQGVILPIIVIRRLECVLLAWRQAKRAELLARRPNQSEKELDKLVKELELNPKQSPFSNKTDLSLRKDYEEDHALLEPNFRAYINGFSKNVDDIIENFNYRATIGTMVKNNRLAPILNQYKELELGPDQLSGLEMGYIYEELLRRFSEQSGEEAGEYFTPREVIRLMVELLQIPIPDRHLSIYDPASGTGGMLSVAKEHLLDKARTDAERAQVEKFVTVHGQELSRTNYAVCQADLLIKHDRQATVHLGNSLIPHEPHSREPGDQWPENKWRFNRMLSNPPFGVTWGGKDGYEKEACKLEQYLDASCDAIDHAVAAKRSQLETLDALRKAIVQRAVTRGVSASVPLTSTGNAWMEQVPRGWKLVSLKCIADIQGGLTLGKQYDGTLVERPYLRVGNVQDGHLSLDDVSVIELPASVTAGVELRSGDVLMTEGGDLDKLGRGHLWNGEIPGCLHQNHIFAVRCFLHKLKPQFLAYVTAAKYGRDYFEATGKKTTNLACTNATKVGEFPIPLPPLNEQEAICDYLEEKLGELKRLIANIESQIATLTAYRKSLIHECVTGQRRITEADVCTIREKADPSTKAQG